ncbi:MAG: DNA-3-methyladenine glycosylase [Gemmatimonadota bacterium]
MRSAGPTEPLTGSAWRSLLPDVHPLPITSIGGSAEAVAPRLLGCHLLSLVDGVVVAGRIVEVEAYLGPDDPASHAATRAGRTRRNAPMYGAPGTAYVYFIYGMHWCFNVVTGAPGDPQAVLIRALEPVIGTEAMARRRDRTSELANGPARLSEALGINGSLNEHLLSDPPLLLLDGELREGEAVAVSGRIGVREAADWPLRYFIEGNPALSRRGPVPSLQGAVS